MHITTSAKQVLTFSSDSNSIRYRRNLETDYSLHMVSGYTNTLMWFRYTDNTKLVLPTITSTPASGTVVINQVAGATTDGVVHWLVDAEWTAINGTPAAPTLV